MRLLDTDILIDLLRKHPPAVTWLASLPDLPSITGYSVMELIDGCKNTADLRAVKKLIAGLMIVWPTTADCQRALDHFEQFRLSHSLGLLDSLIGNCAVGLNAALSTFNVKHFNCIPGIVTEQPYAR